VALSVKEDIFLVHICKDQSNSLVNSTFHSFDNIGSTVFTINLLVFRLFVLTDTIFLTAGGSILIV